MKLKRVVILLIFSLAFIYSCNNINYEIEILDKPWDSNSYFGHNSNKASQLDNNYVLIFNYGNSELYTEFYGTCYQDKKPVFDYSVINDTVFVYFKMKDKINIFSSIQIEEAYAYKAKIKITLKNKPSVLIARRL